MGRPRESRRLTNAPYTTFDYFSIKNSITVYELLLDIFNKCWIAKSMQPHLLLSLTAAD
jgi:hypothetical protein